METPDGIARLLKWNPFIRSAKGELRQGHQIEVRIQNGKASQMTFRPKIIAAQPQQEIRWQGKLGVRGIFDGEHYFELHSCDGDRSRLVHGEHFSGLLAPFLMFFQSANIKQNFEQMNQALKQRCESPVAN